MSMFRSATTSSSGTVGCSEKYWLPHRPRSSPLTVMNTSERLGRGASRENAAAASITAVVPEASSSAPLQIESTPRALHPSPAPGVPM